MYYYTATNKRFEEEVNKLSREYPLEVEAIKYTHSGSIEWTNVCRDKRYSQK